MLPRFLLAILALCATAAVAVPVAGAGKGAGARSAQYTFDFSAQLVLNDVCPFPVTVDAVGSGHGTAISDKSGNLVRIQEHVVETDTYSANGKTLVGTARFNAKAEFKGGVPTSIVLTGRITTMPLPGGGTFRSSGWADVDPAGEWVMTVDRGLSGNLDAFCAALA